MESFAQYDRTAGVGLRTMYLFIQSIQSKLFSHLIEDGRCAKKLPTITYSIVGIESGIPPEIDITPILKNIGTNSEILAVGIKYHASEGQKHYGGLLFNIPEKIFTLYDPSYTVVAEFITPLIREIEDKTGFGYYPVPCYKSFQHITNDKYCSLWTLMVMYLVCKSRLSVHNIVLNLNNLNKERLTKEINGFINFIYLKMKDIELMDEAKQVVKLIMSEMHNPQYHYSIKMMDTVTNEEPLLSMMEMGLHRTVDVNEINAIFFNIGLPTTDPVQVSFFEKLGYPMDLETFISGIGLFYTFLPIEGDAPAYIPGLLFEGLCSVFVNLGSHFYDDLLQASGELSNDFKAYQNTMARLAKKITDYYFIPYGNSYKVWNFLVEFFIRFLVPDIYHNYSPPEETVDLIHVRAEYYTMQLEMMGEMSEENLMALLYNPVPYVDTRKLLNNLKEGMTFIEADLDASLLRGEVQLNRYRDRLVVYLSGLRGLSEGYM